MENTSRRDRLQAIEKEVQTFWQKTRTFEPDKMKYASRPKYMITFPYPYMNGFLHVGHAYSLSKAQFMAGFQHLLGKNVLFPFAYHGSGIRITYRGAILFYIYIIVIVICRIGF